MTLQATLNTTRTIISAAQKQLGNSSNNISNVDTKGYIRKELTHQSQVLGGHSVGLDPGSLTRVVDESKANALNKQVSLLEKFRTLSQFQGDIQGVLGAPGRDEILSDMITDFSSQLHHLSNNPLDAKDGARLAVIHSAQQICSYLNRFESDLQTFRENAEDQISTAVDEVNNKRKHLADINKGLDRADVDSKEHTNLLDQRDLALRDLSQNIHFTLEKNPSGSVRLFVGGQPLRDGEPLSFQKSSHISAQESYPEDLKGIHINTHDLTTNLMGGRLKGLFEVRDTVTTDIQEALDEFSVQFRDTVNDYQNRATAAIPPTQLTGIRSFETPSTDTFSGSGTLRLAVVDRTTGSFIEHRDVDLASFTTIEDLVSDFNTMDALTASVSENSPVTLSTTNENHGIALVSVGGEDAKETHTGFTCAHYFGFNNLLTTGESPDGSVDGGAGRLKVRENVAGNPKRLTTSKLFSDPVVSPGQHAVRQGNNEGLRDLIHALKEKTSFAAAGSLPAQNKSFHDYISGLFSAMTTSANETSTQFKEAENLHSILEEAMESISGVNMQDEFANIMTWQKSHRASSQLIKVVKEMMDDLMSIV